MAAGYYYRDGTRGAVANMGRKGGKRTGKGKGKKGGGGRGKKAGVGSERVLRSAKGVKRFEVLPANTGIRGEQREGGMPFR